MLKNIRESSKAIAETESLSATVQDQEQWMGNWIWRAVHTLVESPDFNSSPKWIGLRLNISIEKAVEAIEGLERLGFIYKDNNSFKVTESWYQMLPEKLTAQKIFDSHSKVAIQILNKMKSDDSYTTQFFVGNRELVKKYAPQFMELYKQINDEGMQLGMTEIIASELSFVQLTKDESTGTSGGAQ